MQSRVAVLLLLFVLGVPALYAQVEEVVEEETATETTATDTSAPANGAGTVTQPVNPPWWIPLIKTAAIGVPITVLALAWIAGAIVHFRLVRREHEQFPVMRGSRTPQYVPIVLSSALFLVPIVLFAFFEYRARWEMSRGLSGVVDQWLPVGDSAWIALVICLVLALAPWLFARRADTVS